MDKNKNEEKKEVQSMTSKRKYVPAEKNPKSTNISNWMLPTVEEIKRLPHDDNECPIQFHRDSENEVSVGAWCTPGHYYGDDFKKLVGVKDYALAARIFLNGINAIPGDVKNNYNLVAQMLHDMKPQNANEAMLCTQILALHEQGMSYLKRAEGEDMLHFRDADLNSATKLLRLQHETVETLNRLKRGNEQKVTVQHVNVSGDGKAIVGNFEMGGGGT